MELNGGMQKWKLQQYLTSVWTICQSCFLLPIDILVCYIGHEHVGGKLYFNILFYFLYLHAVQSLPKIPHYDTDLTVDRWNL